MDVWDDSERMTPLQEDIMNCPCVYVPQAKGNAAFSAGRFDEAIQHFTAGIEADPTNHVLYSNRSAAAASKEDYSAALDDAKKARNKNKK
jgi:tetratricopeptide (TPR) repeat protein